MIFRDFTCVAVLDWDMVSLAGGESDLAWWILQDQGSAARLPGVGSLDETVELWEQLTGRRAQDLRYYLAFNAFRLGAIRIRLAHQMAAMNGPSSELSDLEANNVAIQQLSLMLGLTPAGPVTATLPDLSR
jgi:aminoglycoside phosphotransferase (APT) family kinase protein